MLPDQSPTLFFKNSPPFGHGVVCPHCPNSAALPHSLGPGPTGAELAGSHTWAGSLHGEE